MESLLKLSSQAVLRESPENQVCQNDLENGNEMRSTKHHAARSLDERRQPTNGGLDVNAHP